MRRFLVILISLAVVGCASYRENLHLVTAVNGSNDHRIFRIASLTKLMMIPVIDSLEADALICLDDPVTEYFKSPLPVEYKDVTLRDLYENKSGMCREFLDNLSLADVFEAFHCGFAGIDIYRNFGRREDFVSYIHRPRNRVDVKKKVPQYSNMGFALLMMAITDKLDVTIEELCEERLVKRFGLVDTSFEPSEGMKERLTMACAGHLPWLYRKGSPCPDHQLLDVAKYTGGLKSSASDMLKVFNSLWPMIDEMKIETRSDGELAGLFKVKKLDSGRKIAYRQGMIYGGNSFVGFDPVDHNIVIILKNVTCWPSNEGFKYMNSIIEQEDFTPSI